MALFKSVPRWKWLLIGNHRVRFDSKRADPFGPVPMMVEPGDNFTMRIEGADVRLTDTPTVRIGAAVFPLDLSRSIEVPQGEMFGFDDAQVKLFMIDKKGTPYDGGVVKCIIDAPQHIKIDDSVVV